METHDYDKVLFEAVKNRLAPDVSPVWFIMDVLSIGKEAAYRRLRGEVALSLKEAALLSSELGISLNDVANNNSGKMHNYNLFLVDFETPDEVDYKVLQCYLDNICQGCNDPNSQLAVTTNVFPQQLYLRYKSIAKFAVFKWIYQSGERPIKAYHEVRIEDRMQQIFRDSRETHLRIKMTYYIFDRLLCRSLIHDLRYFTSVGLLKEEDTQTICGEAHKLLNYMEQIAIAGKYENGNEVYMYVSDLHFNKSYYNVRSGQYHASIIEACVLSSLASVDKNCYDKMNDWIHSRRRISTLISQSGEPQRISFFKELRRQLDEL
jgi:hypothetical protein